jgi:hypothetical protein
MIRRLLAKKRRAYRADKGTENRTKGTEHCTKGTENCTKGTENCTKGTEHCTKGTEHCTKGTENCTKGTENWVPRIALRVRVPTIAISAAESEDAQSRRGLPD